MRANSSAVAVRQSQGSVSTLYQRLSGHYQLGSLDKFLEVRQPLDSFKLLVIRQTGHLSAVVSEVAEYRITQPLPVLARNLEDRQEELQSHQDGDRYK